MINSEGTVSVLRTNQFASTTGGGVTTGSVNLTVRSGGTLSLVPQFARGYYTNPTAFASLTVGEVGKPGGRDP